MKSHTKAVNTYDEQEHTSGQGLENWKLNHSSYLNKWWVGIELG